MSAEKCTRRYAGAVLAPGMPKQNGATCGPTCGMTALGRPRPTSGVFAYTPDRKGEHPIAHFAGSHGHAAGGWDTRGTKRFIKVGRVREAGVAWRMFSQAVLTNCYEAHSLRSERKRLTDSRPCMPRGRDPRPFRRGRREVRMPASRPLLESLKQWFEEDLGQASRGNLIPPKRFAMRRGAGRVNALLRRWPSGDRQYAAERSLRTVVLGRKKLFILWIGYWRRTRRGDLRPHWDSKTQRPEPRSVTCVRCSRESLITHQPHRGTAALEPRSGTRRKIKPRCIVKASCCRSYEENVHG